MLKTWCVKTLLRKDYVLDTVIQLFIMNEFNVNRDLIYCGVWCDT